LSSQEINKKDNFGRNYKEMQNKFGVEEFNFHPETFVIPENLAQLKEQAALNPLEKWIAKPVLGGQVSVVHYLFVKITRGWEFC
jgi:hypothetical protein